MMSNNYITLNKAILILLIYFPSMCFAQVKNIGIPYIKNYPRSVYGAGTQNWGIVQDKNGYIYFADNDGLLCFDGVRWNVNDVSDNSPVRSVFVDSNNNIFVGLINDFGIFTRNGLDKPFFTSLKQLLPPEIDAFDDVWRIHEIPEGIVFQTYDYLFIYKNNKIEVLKPQKQFHFSFKINDQLFLHEPENGIYEFKEGKLVKLTLKGEHKDTDISAILEAPNNELLICTPGDGVYITEKGTLKKWDTPVNKLLQQHKIYCASPIPGAYYAFGTILNGLIIADFEGNIIQTLNSSNGIQNNTILSLFVDANENLWMGLDNGIDYLEINSPISFINNFEDIGTGYCCKVFQKNLYLGTNQGLFVRPFNKSFNNQPFQLVKNTAGQVWSLEEFDGQLICGHNLGTFIVEGSEARNISDIEGAWKYIRLKNNPDYLLGGHYEGLVLLKKEKNGWEFYKKLKGFNESSRFIKQSQNGDIWISHGGKGVFRIRLNGVDTIKESEFYIDENGLPSSTHNILFEFKDKLYVSTINEMYEYEKESNSFVVSEAINQLLKTKGRIRVFEEDDAGNVWYTAGKETGVLRHNEDGTYTKITSPFKRLSGQYVNEFEFIYPYANENIFIGIETGFVHYTSKFPKSYTQTFQSFITEVKLQYLDSTIYINSSSSDNKFEFPFRKNAIRISFAAPFFENDAPLEFSYFLEDFSEDWSEWSTDSYKDFTTLHEGEYTFQLKAKNIYDAESEISVFEFIILPPWHRTKWAYFVYAFFLLILILLLKKFIHYRIQLSNKREKLNHQLELQKKEAQFQQQALIDEKEIIKLRNDKLRVEKVHRDKELANQTMGIIQKNKFLKKLYAELQLLQSLSDDAIVKSKLPIIKRKINKEIDNEEQNQLFETYFEEVHSEFFKRLKEQYPQLSLSDLRLCAYIRMNISTKEIATLLNITFKGIEIRRYRLRKKIGLSREINLSIFLSNM